MSTLQEIITSLVPKSWARSMEEESRKWKVTCSCGHSVSVWDLGGIRWKAAGNPRKYRCCSLCGKYGWLTIRKEG